MSSSSFAFRNLNQADCLFVFEFVGRISLFVVETLQVRLVGRMLLFHCGIAL